MAAEGFREDRFPERAPANEREKEDEDEDINMELALGGDKKIIYMIVHDIINLHKYDDDYDINKPVTSNEMQVFNLYRKIF